MTRHRSIDEGPAIIGVHKMDHERVDRRHPLVDEAAAAVRRGDMSRRSFMRAATLLGVGLGAARAMIGGGAPARAQAQASDVPADAAPTPREGGVLRCAMQVQEIDDPARLSWTESGNIVRHQHDYLTITGADNITRPMLASGWSASDDLKTWTFQLREGVRWHNGDDFNAEDVAFNFNRWLDPRTRSSNLGLFDAMVETYDTGAVDAAGAPIFGKRPLEGAVEVVDPLTIRLHLATPVLSMPENLYNYPTAIVHRGFEGDVAAERNGTGAYQIIEHIPGEISISRKVRQSDWRYWGGSAPHIGPGHLDEIQYLHFEPSDEASLRAMMSVEVDMVHALSPELLDLAGAVPGATIWSADTAQTGCLRMRVSEPPFDDLRVRRAVQLCCDAEAFVDDLFAGRGQVGEHHHVSPIHPDYFPLTPRPRRDVDAAKGLLAAAGYPDGVDIELAVGNTSGVWQQRMCEFFAEQAAPAGVRISVKAMSPAEYRAVWNTTPFGLTHWTHRPLGTMALSLGYRSEVPWNETGFKNPAFDAALSEAEALLDVRARRDAMEPVERMLQDAAVLVQPFWTPVFVLAADRVKALEVHPALYHQFNQVWLDA